MPDAIGMYLGLTGRSIGAADAFALGLLTHCIPAARYEEIKSQLAETWPVDPLLDGSMSIPARASWRRTRARSPSASQRRAWRTSCGVWSGRRGAARLGSSASSPTLRARAPLSLKVTHRHIRDSRARDLRQTLQVDYRLACRFLEGHDFYEGVRAALIDKDGRPRWQPERLEDVSAAMVEDYFAPMGSAELFLPTREEMQAARV